MKMTMLSVVLAATGGAAHAGVTLKSVDGAGQATVISIEGNRLRIDERQVLIYDGDKKQLITADPRRHTYSLANESDIKKMGADIKKQMESSQAEMRKQMATMPPEQRKQMEEAMNAQAAQGGGVSARSGRAAPRPAAKYESLGEKKQVAGHSCDVYKVVRSNTTEKGCFIPWSDGAVTKDDLKPFDGFASFMATMTESMGGSRDRQDEWSREMRNGPGVPALLVNASGKTKMQLKSIERGAIDADMFNPPAGYKKSDKGMFGE